MGPGTHASVIGEDELVSIEDALQAEVARRADGWLASGITSDVQCSPRDRDKTATWVVLEGPSGTAQLTVWSSAEAEEECLSHDSEVVEQTHHDALGVDELQAVLDRLPALVARN